MIKVWGSELINPRRCFDIFLILENCFPGFLTDLQDYGGIYRHSLFICLGVMDITNK